MDEIAVLKMHKDGKSKVAPILEGIKGMELKVIDEWWKEQPEEVKYTRDETEPGEFTERIEREIAEEERVRKAKLAKYVRRNRQAIFQASNSAIAVKVQRERVVDLHKREKEISLLSMQFSGILRNNMIEKNKMQRSHERLKVNKRNILIESQKKRRIEDIKHDFKSQAQVVLANRHLSNEAANALVDDRNEAYRNKMQREMDRLKLARIEKLKKRDEELYNSQLEAYNVSIKEHERQ